MAVLVNTLTATPGAVLTTLYTVPANKRTTVKHLQVTNIGAGAETFRIAISTDGAAIVDAHYIAYDMALAANDKVSWSGLFLGETDIVRVYGSDANVQFFISFYEDDE